MRESIIAAIALMGMSLCSCMTSSTTEEGVKSGNNQTKMENCNIKLDGVSFEKSQNLGEETLSMNEDTLRIIAGEQTDFFCDPKGKATNTTAPMIHSTIDNTRPFTFTVKVTPEFTPEGTYSAWALFAFVDDNHWQKLCFEQDEDGNHRIVTVRTVETSDDNNHQKLDLPSVYLRMSSDTEVIGNYYSEDGENWHLVRIYKNEFPDTLFLSLSAQSPKAKSHACSFSEVSMVNKVVSDLRSGSF